MHAQEFNIVQHIGSLVTRVLLGSLGTCKAGGEALVSPREEPGGFPSSGFRYPRVGLRCRRGRAYRPRCVHGSACRGFSHTPLSVATASAHSVSIELT